MRRIAAENTTGDVVLFATGQAPHGTKEVTLVASDPSGKAATATTIASVFVRGPAGSTDTSFAAGSNPAGVVRIVPAPSSASSLTCDAQGRIVVGGTSAQIDTLFGTRMTEAGEPDRAFGTAGRATMTAPAGYDKSPAPHVRWIRRQ